MSFLQQLQEKRLKLKETTTIITKTNGERYLESKTQLKPKKITSQKYGFIVDTKPDNIPAIIIENFLYLGSQDAVNIDNIITFKLTHILSIGIEMPAIDIVDIKNVYLPCLDLPETNISIVIKEAIEFIKYVKNCHGHVLVHCNAGVSRSASIIIAYLILESEMDFDVAYNLVKTKRNCIQPNVGFLKQLKTLK